MSPQSIQTAIIVQARMTSTRLPGKVLMPVFGQPLLMFLVERLRRVRQADLLMLAITTNATDDPLAAWAEAHDMNYVRGSEDDVLSRYVLAADTLNLQDSDAVVRVTSDCPLIDPTLVDAIISRFLRHDSDYISTGLSGQFPRGLDCEVVSAGLLRVAYREASQAYQREHVTPFFYQQPERFRLAGLENPLGDHAHHRWTVDTPEDFALIECLLTALYPQNPEFLQADILAVLAEYPEWVGLNAHIEQKKLDSLQCV